MIKVSVLCGLTEDPAEVFIDATTRFVRVPDMAGSLLYVNADKPSHMVVEVDGEPVFTTQLEPRGYTFPLLQVLRAKRIGSSRRSLLSLMTGGGDSKPLAATAPEAPRTFTAVIRDEDQYGSVSATFDFQLLSDVEFDTRYNDTLEARVNVVEPTVFTTDARSPEQLNLCWNCRSNLDHEGPCSSCGCEQHHDDE